MDEPLALFMVITCAEHGYHVIEMGDLCPNFQNGTCDQFCPECRPSPKSKGSNHASTS